MVSVAPTGQHHDTNVLQHLASKQEAVHHSNPTHLSCCNAADALLNPAPQVRLPQVVQAHAPVGADQGLAQGCGVKGLRGNVLHGIPTLQLLLDVLCRTHTDRQGQCWRELVGGIGGMPTLACKKRARHACPSQLLLSDSPHTSHPVVQAPQWGWCASGQGCTAHS